MIVRKIWHVFPQEFRSFLNDKIGLQKKVLQWSIRRKAKKLKKIKNIAEGKRCFIIGNGPSLTIDDLEKLKKEDTFACNYIFKIFDRTSWRPTYYTIQDYLYLEKMGWKPDESVGNCKALFVNGACLKNRDYKYYKENEYYFYCNGEGAYEGNVKFSDDISRNIYEGATVTYTNIQIAAYMGYAEIYLIGVDHNYPAWKDGNNVDDNLNYMEGLGNNSFQKNPPSYAIMEIAYKKALEECNKHGIKIYNATRGGKLEVFERINFEGINL